MACPAHQTIPKTAPIPKRTSGGGRTPNPEPPQNHRILPFKTTQSFCTKRVFAPILVQKVVQKHGFWHHLYANVQCKTYVFASRCWCKNINFCVTKNQAFCTTLLVPKPSFWHHIVGAKNRATKNDASQQTVPSWKLMGLCY